jgi:hypothetical protein
MSTDDYKDAQLLVWAARIDLAMADRQINQARLAMLMDTDPATVCRLLKGYDSKASTYLSAFHALGIEVTFTRIA